MPAYTPAGAIERQVRTLPDTPLELELPVVDVTASACRLVGLLEHHPQR